VTNASGPVGGASALPRPSSRNRGRGPTSKGKIGKGRGREREMESEREGEWMGIRGGKGRGLPPPGYEPTSVVSTLNFKLFDL